MKLKRNFIINVVLVMAVIIVLSSNVSYALDIRFLQLDKLPKGLTLSYEIKEEGVSTPDHHLMPTSILEIYTLTTTETDGKGNVYRWYEIAMVDENKKSTVLKFKTKDGGSTIEAAALKLPTGEQSMLDNPDKVRDLVLFENAKFELKEAGERKLFDVGSKTFMGKKMVGETKETHEVEKGGIVLETKTNINETYWMSESKDLPILLASKRKVKTHKYAYLQGNTDVKFPNMDKNFTRTFSMKVIEVNEGVKSTKIKGLGPEK